MLVGLKNFFVPQFDFLVGPIHFVVVWKNLFVGPKISLVGRIISFVRTLDFVNAASISTTDA
ncbi:MAG: hypothetical protein H8M99_12065 [Gloeobacteraceae cyanobacterium ES-bin-144]|nr:hypothetical protein [Verrucomicrobiales bacterium]